MKSKGQLDLDDEVEITEQQKKAIHVYYREVSKLLWAHGLGMREVLKPEVEIPWTASSVKSFMWNPVKRVVLGHDKKCNEKQTLEVVKLFQQHLAKFHIYIHFTGIKNYLEQVAEQLNERGLDMRAVLKESVNIPWTPKLVKEFLWKPVLKLLTGKTSTNDHTTKDVQQVFEIVNRHLAKFGAHQPFPSVDAMLLAMRGDDGAIRKYKK